MRPVLTLENGGRAEVVETDGTHVVLRSSHPAPPGSILAAVLPGTARPYRVKVRGSRRVGDGDPLEFRVEGRFVDVTREQRDALARLISPPDPP
jgi:hypothetical protein